MERNTLLQLWLCFPNKIFQYDTRAQIAKAFKGFDHRPNPHLTLAPTRPQLTDPLSLHLTRILFLKVDISEVGFFNDPPPCLRFFEILTNVFSSLCKVRSFVNSGNGALPPYFYLFSNSPHLLWSLLDQVK